MMTNLVTLPKFSEGQVAKFISGVGIIKSCRLDSGKWFYLDVIPMKLDSNIDKVSYETMIWLSDS
jgi:hypothetical protein